MKNIYTKLFEIQKKKLEFKRTATNPFHKSKYCPLPEVWNTLEPALAELQLLCVHKVKDGILTTTIIDVEDYGESAKLQQEEVSTEIHINSSDAQKTGAEITYYKRYNLGCIFNAITDEDTDGGTPKGEPKEKEVFDLKKLTKFQDWAKGKTKQTVMQEVLRFKKQYTFSQEMTEEIDKFLSTLK